MKPESTAQEADALTSELNWQKEDDLYHDN